MVLLAKLLYMLCIILFCLYLFQKYLKRAYIISTFNIGTFIYTFDIVISPVFFFNNSTWYGLGVLQAVMMWDYLNKALIINAVGYIIYIIVLMLNEFNNRQPFKILQFSKKISNSISNQWITISFVFLVFIWHIICLNFCSGYPLFNGKRTFYLDTTISPIYLFINEALLMFTFFFAIKYTLHKKKLIYMIIGTVTIALQGNRAALITNLILPITVVFVYQKIINIKMKKQYYIDGSGDKINKYNKRKLIKKFIIILPLLVTLGLWLQFVRKGGNISISQIVFELFYGNTFSDIRDGAYILKGFKENTNAQLLYGKTYLAAFISFIPSYISKFRYIWSWGRYTTIGLFGVTNHFGLRGGNVMESYINFGWFGVVIVAILQGIIASKLEKIFYFIFIKEEFIIDGKEYFVFYILYLIYGMLSASSSAYNIYVLMVIIIFLIFATNLVRKSRRI